MGGTPATEPEAFRRSSPITYADRVAAPVLLVVGENDSRCPVGQALAYADRLKEQGKPHEAGQSIEDDKPSSLRMDVESDDPCRAASGAVDLARRLVAFVGELEREEQGVVARRATEVEATDRHPTSSMLGIVLRMREAPVDLCKSRPCRAVRAHRKSRGPSVGQ